MGSSEDRGGKAAPSGKVGAMMGFLRLETLMLSAAIMIGHGGNFLFRGRRRNHNHNWRARSQGYVCTLNLNNSTVIQPREVVLTVRA